LLFFFDTREKGFTRPTRQFPTLYVIPMQVFRTLLMNLNSEFSSTIRPTTTTTAAAVIISRTLCQWPSKPPNRERPQCLGYSTCLSPDTERDTAGPPEVGREGMEWGVVEGGSNGFCLKAGYVDYGIEKLAMEEGGMM